MKFQDHLVSRKQDHVGVYITARDRMRRPVRIRVTVEQAPVEGASEAWSGEAHDFLGLFGGFAEIAWAAGWRPRGLENVIANTVRTFKIPKETA